LNEYTIPILMKKMPDAFQPDRAVGIDAIILFNITGNDHSEWTVIIKDQICSVTKGIVANPQLTLTADSKDCLDIFTGRIEGTRAFMQGKLKLAGDIALAMKLLGLFKI